MDKEILAKALSGVTLLLGAVGIQLEPEWAEKIVIGVFALLSLLSAVRTWYKSKRHTEKEATEKEVEKKQKDLAQDVKAVQIEVKKKK